MSDRIARRAVLVGAGHAHLHVASHARQFADRGVRLTLVDPGAFWYSGMATGMLGGMYGRDEDRVDVQRLIERHGGAFVRGRLVSLDVAMRTLRLDTSDELAWDALSFNVGSEVDDDLPGAAEHAWAVKPIARLWDLRQRLETLSRESHVEPVRIVVIGGGATGCETALNIDALLRRGARPYRITLLTRAGRLIPDHPAGAARWLLDHLRRRGLSVRLQAAVSHVEEGAVVLKDGEAVAADAALVATGLRPPRWLRGLPLPIGEDGGLNVDERLQVIGHPGMFGVGDCIHFAGRTLPKLGVFGVREAPVLLHNLLASLAGRPLRRYRPQRAWLSILNLGDGGGLAARGRWWWHGRSAMWLKDGIDRRFVARYRV